jgi:O-antigen ligase
MIKKNFQWGHRKKILLYFIIIMLIYILINWKISLIAPDANRRYIKIIISFLLLFLGIISELDQNKIKNIILVAFSTGIIPIFSSIILWINKNYAFQYRYHSIALGDWFLLPFLYTFFIFFYKKTNLIPISFVSIFYLLLSGSRGPTVAYCMTCILMIILQMRKNIKHLVSCILIFVLSIFLILNINTGMKKRFLSTPKDTSTISRLFIMKEGLRQFKKHMFLGNGIETYHQIVNTEQKKIKNPKNLQEVSSNGKFIAVHSHNNFVEILRSMGLIGTAIYVIMFLHMIKMIITTYQNTKINLLLFPIFLFIAANINGLSDMTLFYGFKRDWIVCFSFGLAANYCFTIQNSGGIQWIKRYFGNI